MQMLLPNVIAVQETGNLALRISLVICRKLACIMHFASYVCKLVAGVLSMHMV